MARPDLKQDSKTFLSTLRRSGSTGAGATTGPLSTPTPATSGTVEVPGNNGDSLAT